VANDFVPAIESLPDFLHSMFTILQFPQNLRIYIRIHDYRRRLRDMIESLSEFFTLNVLDSPASANPQKTTQETL
jgi:hypothetical protein